MTKAAFSLLQHEVKMLAMQIGLRAAARATGLKETRVLKWASRDKWGVSAVHPVGFRQPTVSAEVIAGNEAMQNILKSHRSRTQLGMAQSATKVFEHLAEQAPEALVKPATAIAGQQWSKVADITHGYVAERTAAPSVNVAVVALPSESDQAQRAAMHARLDDIARLLGDSG